MTDNTSDEAGSALEQLLGRARGPMGPSAELDFGVEEGPLAELGSMISRINGFFAFNAGIQVFRVGEEGYGADLLTWNSEDTWKDTYDGLADDLFCFGQDIFGRQFAIEGGEEVVLFDPETARVTTLGDSLEDWAAWLLADEDVNGAASFAYAYQKEKGALDAGERLVPLTFFIAGGGYDFDNFVARDAALAMRIRGPIAQQVHDLPEGATVRISAS